MHSVLLVEDDDAIRAALSRMLRDNHFSVLAVGTAAEALCEVASRPVDIVLLDLGLPDLDGTSTLRMIRGSSSVPVIVVTARREETSVVQLLNAGADDYVVKPFSGQHLLARIQALLRRTSAKGTPDLRNITVGALEINPCERVARFQGEQMDLTRKEFDFLFYLAERVNRVVSRRELLEDVWGESEKRGDQTINVHLSWLRRKLGESAARPAYLHTVRGVGVKLMEPC